MSFRGSHYKYREREFSNAVMTDYRLSVAMEMQSSQVILDGRKLSTIDVRSMQALTYSCLIIVRLERNPSSS